jgi:hypothetical protein
MRSIIGYLLASAFLASAILPAAARWHHPPRCYPVSPGLVLKTSQYQQPDGTYDRLSDFVRDVNGTPCGIDCPAPARIIFASPPTFACYPN